MQNLRRRPGHMGSGRARNLFSKPFREFLRTLTYTHIGGRPSPRSHTVNSACSALPLPAPRQSVLRALGSVWAMILGGQCLTSLRDSPRPLRGVGLWLGNIVSSGSWPHTQHPAWELTLRDQRSRLPSPPEHHSHLLGLCLPFNNSALQQPLAGSALLCILLWGDPSCHPHPLPGVPHGSVRVSSSCSACDVSGPLSSFWANPWPAWLLVAWETEWMSLI